MLRFLKKQREDLWNSRRHQGVYTASHIDIGYVEVLGLCRPELSEGYRIQQSKGKAIFSERLLEKRRRKKKEY